METEFKEIRVRVDEIFNTVSKLWGAFRELAADYWGPNKANGFRSRVEDHETRLSAVEDACRHYVDAERRETCYGVAALEEHKKLHEEMAREAEKAEKVEGEVEVEKIKANSATIIQVLTLVGVVLGPVLLKLVETWLK